MNKFLAIGGFSAAIFFSIRSLAETGTSEAVHKLLEGNQRYVLGKLAKKDLGEAKRQELAKGQHPFAVILACSDSRVAPELLFDQGIGDLFVIRAAGNVVDKIALGSMEYAIEHLHCPLLLVLGHQSCGAVKAALESSGSPEGNIGEIVKKIKPAAIRAKNAGLPDQAELLDLAVQENIRNVYQEILEKSGVVKEGVEEGKLKVLIGEYYLETGKVKLLDNPEEAAAAGGEPLAPERSARKIKPSRPFPTAEPAAKAGKEVGVKKPANADR